MELFHSDFSRYRATGAQDAFRAVVEKHLPMVLGVAARRLGPHAAQAEDVAQAVFMRLARCARGLPADLEPASWLHRQAVRLAIDAVRREERRLRRESTAAATMNTPTDPTPEASRAALLTDAALDSLPAAERSALVLRYLEGRPLAEVAVMTGSTTEAVRKRIARSLEKLRAFLQRRGVILSAAALGSLLTEQKAAAAVAPALAAKISAAVVNAAPAGWTGVGPAGEGVGNMPERS